MIYDLSVIIPARNEEFLSNTVEDLLRNIRGNTEIIAVLDGYWPDPPIKDNPKVTLLHFSEAVGQRAGTNYAARISKSKYLVKTDAHCAFDEGFDVKLMDKMQDNFTMVPVMRNLHVFDWVCSKCGDRRYQGNRPTDCPKCDNKTDFHKDIVWIGKANPQCSSYCFDPEPHFQYFREFKSRPEGKGELTETMSLQGSFFMCTREKYHELNLCDEEFGNWGSQGIEVSLRTRLSGGVVVCNHNTWYAHLFRTKGGDFGFPWPASGRQIQGAKKYARDLFFENKWEQQIYPLSKVIKQFWPIPGWSQGDLDKLLQDEMRVDRAGVYSIKNKKNGKVYVGSAIDISRRFGEHLKMFHKGNHENDHLQKSWNKYGEEAFTFDIEFFCKPNDLVSCEQQFIDTYSQNIGWDNMYNINPVAGSSLGRKHTEDSLLKMSQQQSGEGNGFYGKKHSPESIEKMRESHKGKEAWNKGIPWTDDIKEKISNSKIGHTPWNKNLTKETDERVRLYGEKMQGIAVWADRGHPRGMLGKKHSDETKHKISETMSIAAEGRQRNDNGQFVSAAHSDRGIVYYSDNRIEDRLGRMVQQRLLDTGLPIVSVTLKPVEFGDNVVLNLERGYLTMFKQILAGLERIDTELVWLCEHDVLYTPEHFEFTPLCKDRFYYNKNNWQVRQADGHAVFWDCKKVSQCVAYRELFLKHYRERVRKVEEVGFSRRMGFEPGTHGRPERVDDYKSDFFETKIANLDVRHKYNLTSSRWSPDKFRNPCKNWTESHVNKLPGWEDLKL
jgi:group I intron endonuclease